MKRPTQTPKLAGVNDDDASPFAEELVSSVQPRNSRKVMDGRTRLLAALDKTRRLGHLAEAVVDLLDVDESRALDLLERAGGTAAYASSPFEGITLFHVTGGPSVATAITGFVRVPGGTSFPVHSHLGKETILIVQGSCLVEETGAILRSGDTLVSTAADVHAVVARPGPDLVYLAVVHGGIRVGDSTILPGDPRA